MVLRRLFLMLVALMFSSQSAFSQNLLSGTVELNSQSTNGPAVGNGDGYGISVTYLGDVDGDGIGDIASGAVRADVG